MLVRTQAPAHLQVMESWGLILRGAPMSISLEDVRVYAGDTAAYVTCVEVMDAGDSRGRCVQSPTAFRLQ